MTWLLLHYCYLIYISLYISRHSFNLVLATHTLHITWPICYHHMTDLLPDILNYFQMPLWLANRTITIYNLVRVYAHRSLSRVSAMWHNDGWQWLWMMNWLTDYMRQWASASHQMTWNLSPIRIKVLVRTWKVDPTFSYVLYRGGLSVTVHRVVWGAVSSTGQANTSHTGHRSTTSVTHNITSHL